MTWIVLALASAVFAGATAVLAKAGVKDVDSNLATALRTIVVALFAWGMVFVAGSQNTIDAIDGKSLVFLILSGLATGASWLCYFRALRTGDINKVVPIDKSSTVLTVLLAFALLGEPVSWFKAAALVFTAAGTYLMIERKETAGASPESKSWILFALLSAVFASLQAILGKIGITGVESNLGTAIRTVVVLIMAWIIVFAQGGHKQIPAITNRSWLFLGFSGLATGLSWLCYYRALQDGLASVVVPIDKLSILITVAFGYFMFGEKLRKKPLLGLALIVVGTIGFLM